MSSSSERSLPQFNELVTNTLYTKLFIWLLLNIFLLAGAGLLFFIWICFGNTSGLFPAHFFSDRIENTYRTISADLQYRPFENWAKTLAVYDEEGRYRFYLAGLGEAQILYMEDSPPEEVLAAAASIPHVAFTLCPEEDGIFRNDRNSPLAYDPSGTELGLPATPPALFLRAGGHYWYGRALFIPDDLGMLHYVLLATESASLTGNGLFFDFHYIGIIAVLALLFSFLWWLPFIWHIVSPLLCMVRYAESVTVSPGGVPADVCRIPLERRDEIGRLGRALNVMVEKITRQMTGQQKFIRHIAHELNTPLAHSIMGLTVLEDDLEGRQAQRIRKVVTELETLSHLTEDVLTYLRSQYTPGLPQREAVHLYTFLSHQLRTMHGGERVKLDIDDDYAVFASRNDLCIAVSNAVRNALAYAGEQAEVIVSAFPHLDGFIAIRVCDNGPGVPEEELPHLLEPFFRGGEAQNRHPGGTGLGLAIIKSSIEQNGGSVHCSNAVPHGFCLTMLLPEDRNGRSSS